MHQPQIVVHPLLETNEQFAEAIVPRPRALNDPPASKMSFVAGDSLTSTPDVRDVVPLPHRGRDHGEVISFVQAEVVGTQVGGPWPFDGDLIQG